MHEMTASVMICVYNRGKDVQRCLYSLLALDDQSEIAVIAWAGRAAQAMFW